MASDDYSPAPAPADHWRTQLQRQLDQLDDDAMRRSLRTLRHDGPIAYDGDRPLINFAGNDYLGLAQHPSLTHAVAEAVREHGFGSGASRLVTGNHPLHVAVEQRFAQFKHAEGGVLCPTGFMANLAAVSALVGKGDLIAADKLCHASMIDAARASGATVRTYAHLDLARLERLLERGHADVAQARQQRRIMIMTDSVFSMDGDVADLPGLRELADRYGAILYVDEAHGTGVLGETGGGLAEAQGVAGRVDVTVSTASKALGGLGGIITAQREVVETIINRGRSFIYTTAAPPGQAAALLAALDLLHRESYRRVRLRELSFHLAHQLRELGWALPPRQIDTPILPLIVGRPDAALDLSRHLADRGILAPAIRPPTVAPGTSRIRLSLRADLNEEHVNRLINALREWRTAEGDR